MFFYFDGKLYNDTYENVHVLIYYSFCILRKSSILHGIFFKASFGSIVQGVASRDPVVFFLSFFFFLKIIFLYFFRGRRKGGGREKHQCARKTLISCLSHTSNQGPACNQACALTRNRADDLSLCGGDTQPTEPHQSGPVVFFFFPYFHKHTYNISVGVLNLNVRLSSVLVCF